MRAAGAIALVLGGSAAGCSLVAGLGDPKVFDAGTGSQRGVFPRDVPDGAEADATLDGDELGSVLGDEDALKEANATDAPEGVIAEGGFDSNSSACDSFDGGSPLAQAVAISVASTHACAVVNVAPGSPENGTVRCWGSNRDGELGRDPCLSFSSRPHTVLDRALPALSDVGTLALGEGFSCAITTPATGFLSCWGNVPVVAGEVTRDPTAPEYLPSLMRFYNTQLEQIVTASLSAAGGCASRTDQSLLCWGMFASGTTRIGNGGGEGGAVNTPESFEAVVVGRAHACVIATRNGVRDVECWGDNTQGQAGFLGVSSVGGPAAVGVSQCGQVTQLAVGGDQSCAVVQNAVNAVYCWGSNASGQLLDAGGGSAVRRVAFGSMSDPKEVAVGDSHACARMTDGSVWCWGDNSASQLGTGPPGPAEATPSVVKRRNNALLQGVDRVAAGGKTTCVTLATDPNVRCWGANDYGQAGQPPQSMPVPYATLVAW